MLLGVLISSGASDWGRWGLFGLSLRLSLLGGLRTAARANGGGPLGNRSRRTAGMAVGRGAGGARLIRWDIALNVGKTALCMGTVISGISSTILIVKSLLNRMPLAPRP